MSQRIITGSLTRSIGAARWTLKPQSQWGSVRQSSNKPTPVSTREKVISRPTIVASKGNKQSKFRHSPPLELPKLDGHQEKVRQIVHSALRRDRIEVEKWPSLERFVDASIVQDVVAVKGCLRGICSDLAKKDQTTSLLEGVEKLDPLYVQLSTESEETILQIVHKLSSTFSDVPGSVFDTLFARYYGVGLLSYAERLSDIIGGSGYPIVKHRANLLCIKLKCKQYKDYWEAFEEYQLVRDWCLKRDIKDIFVVKDWFRIIYNLTKAEIQDTINTPSLPIEITFELLDDHNKYVQIENSNLYLKLQCLFLDHYAKKASQALGPEWVLYHQQIIVGMHEALVERYGVDLKGNVAVFTSLLEAYGRVGLPQSAMEVWNRMITSDVGVNSIALSVIFDNCGRLNRLSDARRIFAWLEHSERVDELMDKNVWHSWLECLCRCGALREALHYAFDLMEPALRKRAEVLQDQKRISRSFNTISDGLFMNQPDVKTFNLLLSFSRSRRNRDSYGSREPAIHAEIVRRINEDYPNVSPYIPNHLFTLQS